MPKNCYIPGCKNRSNKHECQHISFYKLPSDNDLRYKWLCRIHQPIVISSCTTICSTHFEGGKKSIDHPVPTIFPWSRKAVKRKPPIERRPMPSAAKKVKYDEPLTAELVDLNKQLSEVKAELEAKSEEVTKLKERVQQLEHFQVPQNDRDAHFFTGLPTYAVFLCLLEPLLSNLRYRSDVSQRDCATPVCSRTRALSPIDELFLTLMKLRLGLLNQDLAYRFNISITSVSRIFRTWLVFLDQQLRPLITWPSRDAIDSAMPPQFK